MKRINWRWWLNRWWFRLVWNDYGCRGEGYYKKPDGTVEPCHRIGCH